MKGSSLRAMSLLGPLVLSLGGAGLQAQEFTDRMPGTWPTWIEGIEEGTILMSVQTESKRLLIASSSDLGKNWKVRSSLPIGRITISGGYFTRLPDRSLLLTVPENTAGKQHWSFVGSTDEGKTWSKPAPPIDQDEAGLPWGLPWGPIYVLQDGRWGVTGARVVNARGQIVGARSFKAEAVAWQSFLRWSSDQGKTWGEPVVFPTPDGNKGLTEATIVQVGPKRLVAAIRSDGGVKGSFDGFYLAWSEDGIKWSVPVSLGEPGRMPQFYKVGTWWALSYRKYAKGSSNSALRFSRDGKEWSKPLILEKGVNTGPALVQVKGRVLAFNARYPDRRQMTRHDITERVPPTAKGAEK